MKTLPKISIIRIQIVSKGSKDLLDRRMRKALETKYNVTWPEEKPYEYQFFSLDHLELRLCNECNTQIANVKWENTTSYFCGEACAKSAWFDQII
jgi:formamidopyrimidine-DNA glycosylase